MIDAIGKYVGGKVVTALCVLGVGAAGLWFWRHPDDLRDLWTVVRRALAWIGLAAALPWTSYAFMRPLLRLEKNAAGAVLLAGFSAIDLLAALWLADWRISGSLSWTVVCIGLVAAAAYNYVICESLARQVDS